MNQHHHRLTDIDLFLYLDPLYTMADILNIKLSFDTGWNKL